MESSFCILQYIVIACATFTYCAMFPTFRFQCWFGTDGYLCAECIKGNCANGKQNSENGNGNLLPQRCRRHTHAFYAPLWGCSTEYYMHVCHHAPQPHEWKPEINCLCANGMHTIIVHFNLARKLPRYFGVSKWMHVWIFGTFFFFPNLLLFIWRYP